MPHRVSDGLFLVQRPYEGVPISESYLMATSGTCTLVCSLLGSIRQSRRLSWLLLPRLPAVWLRFWRAQIPLRRCAAAFACWSLRKGAFLKSFSWYSFLRMPVWNRWRQAFLLADWRATIRSVDCWEQSSRTERVLRMYWCRGCLCTCPRPQRLWRTHLALFDGLHPIRSYQSFLTKASFYQAQTCCLIDLSLVNHLLASKVRRCSWQFVCNPN